MPKRSTSPATANKKDKSEADLKDNKPKTILWQFIPIIVILLTILLIFGRLDYGGVFPVYFYKGAAWLLGWLSWTILPTLVLYFAILKLRQINDKLSVIRLIAGLVFLLSLAGLVHVFLDESQAASMAAEGSHGGHLGHWLTIVFEKPFNALAAFLVLLLINAIALFIALNTTLKCFWSYLCKLWNKRRQANQKAAQELQKAQKELEKEDVITKKDNGFKLNQGVPLETTPVSEKAVVKKPRRALTAQADPDWQFPTLDLLIQKQDKADAGDIQANAEIIKETLANFNIDVEMEGANVGPRVTQYTLKPPSGIKLAKIVGLESNIALDLAASSIRIEAPIPGQRAVGIEVPNKKAATVRISSIFDTPLWRDLPPHSLAFCIGKDIAGEPQIAFLEKMPHILLAGQTGSGKSVGINVLLTSLLYRNSPADLKLILVDPKQVEMGPYNHIPHLLTPVITTPEKCISALKWTVAEMERRLKTFAKVSKRNIAEYNSLKDEPFMPFIVVVIDELADLMMVASRDVETLVVRIAQKARAAGIHLVLATQRPSVDVITGLIKANVPGRLAFTTASQVDSRTILDQVGAEKLLGSGDILYLNSHLPKPKRLQGAFISDDETQKVCDFLREQQGVQYNDEVISQQVTLSGSRSQILEDGQASEIEDELFQQAVEVVIKAQKASTSLLQRRLRIGYARAARLIESLEEQGVIGPADGSRARDVLQTSLDDFKESDEVDDMDLDNKSQNEENEDV